MSDSQEVKKTLGPPGLVAAPIESSTPLAKGDEGVPPGYKRTDVGAVPKEWDLQELSALSAFITKGSTPTTYGFKWASTGTLFLRSECVASHGLDLTEAIFISDKAHQYLRRSEVRDGDILITITGNVGRAVLLKQVGSANINQHIARVRITDPRADPKYVYQYVNQNHVRRHFESITTGQAYPQISLKQVRETVVPLPGLEEQHAIAAALSDADALIESLDRLIAKKRAIKQGVMQQLLTGQTRLPEFEGLSGYKQTEVGMIPRDWDVAELATLISEISMGPFGSDIKVSNFVSEGVPVLSGFNVQRNKLIDDFSNFVTERKATSLKKAVARRGDVVVTHRGTIGQISYIPADSQYDRYVISQSQFKVSFRELVIPQWITLYFLSKSGSEKLLAGKGHTGVPAIAQPTTTFRKLKVPLPTVTEQCAIANTLSDTDAEIEALERRLDKTKQIKQGMMQQLLTGRIRLVEPEIAA